MCYILLTKLKDELLMGKKSELDSTKEGLDSGAANEKTARVDKSNKKKI